MQQLVRMIFFVLLFGCTSLTAVEASKPKICLNMIVKDESAVITRCLNSVLPIIDYWVIVDTGSSDETIEIIKNFMKEKNVPGEIHERPWKNFGHNRNEALALTKGKCDYVLFMDADDYLKFEPDFKLPEVMDKDSYQFTICFAGTRYARTFVVNNKLNWNWVGVLHEVVICPEAQTTEMMQNVYDIVVTDGARSHDPLKYEKDAALLESALVDEPNNGRYVFYLAQSYHDCGKLEQSLKNYEKRERMGGWDEEVYYSLLKIAEIQQRMEMAPEVFLKSFKRAFLYRSSRAEPLYHLANYYRMKGDYETGYKTAKVGTSIAPSKDLLFVQHWIYEWGLPLEHSVCAYWTGNYAECKEISEQMLRKDIPDNVRSTVERNLEFANSKLREKELAQILGDALGF